VIASLEGTVAAISGTNVVLEVGGIGYRVHAGPSTLSRLAIGARGKLHTHHLVREDVQALYGFGSTEELAFFELIITVSGVGPKVGLAIVSSRPVAELQLAILQGDDAVLTAVPGVGKRLAGRIVLELREKVEAAGSSAVSDGGGARVQLPGGPRGRAQGRRRARAWFVAGGSRQGGLAGTPAVIIRPPRW
jgi:holliday junction DNA helicase RuvA